MKTWIVPDSKRTYQLLRNFLEELQVRCLCDVTVCCDYTVTVLWLWL